MIAEREIEMNEMSMEIETQVFAEIPRNEDGSIASPCLRLCKLDENKQCVACLRSIDEIMAWSKADDAYKLAVWGRLAARPKSFMP